MPHSRFWLSLTLSIAALWLSACRDVVDTTILSDGSGTLRTAVVFSAEEQKNFSQSPDNANKSICDSITANLPGETTFSEEERGNETYCVTARTFGSLQDLRQLYAQMTNVTVNKLQFDFGRLTIDIDVDLTQATNGKLVEREWRLTLPGTIKVHNADRVEGNTLVWTIESGQRVNIQVESEVGLSLQTLGVSGAILITSLSCLAAAFVVGSFYFIGRRRSVPTATH